MAVMLKGRTLSPTCMYGRYCCYADHGIPKKVLRRRQRAREKVLTRREASE